MNKTGKSILIKFQKRWQLMLWLEVMVYALGIAVFSGLLFASSIAFGIAFVFVSIIAIVLKAPWRIDLKTVCQVFNQQSVQLEYSTNLVLQPIKQLSGIAIIQQQKITSLLKDLEPNIKPKHQLKKASAVALLMIIAGVTASYFQLNQVMSVNSDNLPVEYTIVLKPIDTIKEVQEIPSIKTQEVLIDYPNYTKLATKSYLAMDITALGGSQVTWKLSFDGSVASASVELNGEKLTLSKSNQNFIKSKVLDQSGFYNFKFTDTLGNSYVSDLYSIDIVSDNSPVILLNDLKAYYTYEYDDKKSFQLKALITDDYGIEKAFVVATVSRGKGESVKFREQQLNFKKPISSGQKKADLGMQIDLDSLEMQPGDELYFYVQAQDQKEPKPNITRSETYFAAIKDTLDYGSGIDSGLGVDLMPDYFRSQRQLIIDTKKLISERGKIPTSEFNRRSNDLAFDQKALRLKYGKFMGQENESQMQPVDSESSDSGQDSEDLLGEYTHDHDGDNEHNLVEDDHDHDHDHGNENQEEKDPLEKYLHNHGDPESSTLFADNLKQKLRQALSIMWDSELHLRLNEPKVSLPYQYRVLKLIQEIKNSARIYVHRIGFDPPPIKEESRLSADLDDIESYTEINDIELKDSYENLRYTIQKLEELKSSKKAPTASDRLRFENAGNEIARMAIESPGKYIDALRKMRQLMDNQKMSRVELNDLQNELLKLLPKNTPKPSKRKGTQDQLNLLVLKELYE